MRLPGIFRLCIAATISPEDDNDQLNLHLFFSETLRGNWSAHPLNPVKTDVRSSRPAGPVIVHDGALFRPAQDCSRSYGYGLSVNRIDHLTVTRFEETVVTSLRPEAISASCKGVHTLSFKDDLMVIDAKFHLIGVESILSGHGARSAPEAGQRSRVHVSSRCQACLSAISSSVLALRSHENS